jgi:hypothetical protein
VCNGAVTKEIGTKFVKICTEGKIMTKTRKTVGAGYPLVGRDTGAGKGESGDVKLSQIINLHFRLYLVWDSLL